MLKVEHLSYEIEEDGKKQEILKDVSFEVADGEKGRFSWTGRISPSVPFMIGQRQESALLFSSRRGLKG